MPYIPQDDRRALTQDSPRVPKTAGELNFALTTVVRRYLGPSYNYAVLNDVLGALEGCKLEFYREVVAPYEDAKKAQNGRVYGE